MGPKRTIENAVLVEASRGSTLNRTQSMLRVCVELIASKAGSATHRGRRDESVQHLGLGPEVRIDGCARLFLCARCFVQVRLCSHCDRGQRYCTPACSSLARNTAQREAARRYQRSRGGRMAHAARLLLLVGHVASL